LVQALGGRADADLAARHAGRKVLVSRIGDGAPIEDAPGSLTQEEWTKLALYLEPVFSAPEGGDIVAEIGEEPHGTLLTGLFEARDVVVVRGVWG
jgi:hypothetical protein